MKLAFFHELPKSSGSRKSLDNIAKILSKKHHIDLFYTASQNFEKENSYYQKIFFYKFKPTFWKGGNWSARLYKDTVDIFHLYMIHKKISKKISDNKYDAVFINGSYLTESPFILRFGKYLKFYYAHAADYSLAAQKVTGIPKGDILRYYYELLNRHFRRIVDKANVRSSSIIIANSLYTKNAIDKIYNRKSITAYLGVNDSIFKPQKRKKIYDVLFIGSRNSIDGYDLLVNAVKLLNIKLAVKVLAVEEEWIENDVEMAKLYNSTKTVVCLSHEEPFGLVAIEAMSCGVPVVAVDEGGYKETVINNKTGILIRRDPKELAKAIITLINNSKKRTIFAKNARAEVKEKWSWKTSVKIIESIFNKEIPRLKLEKGSNSLIWNKEQEEKSLEINKNHIINPDSIISSIRNKKNFLLISILAISAFLNLFKINSLLLFIGDMGHDYLSARDFILTAHIPLVGITSSVTWLHQGPLSVYFIAFSLILGKFNPAAPGIFYGVVGVATTLLIYLLGEKLLSRKEGLIAALLYATSPIIVVSARMPYHTSSIPFFASIFFLLLWKLLNNKKKPIFLSAFFLGLLLLLELSNAILFGVLLVLYFLLKPSITKKDIVKAVFGFLLGIMPFILYDLTHNFVQTIGLPLWAINRVRLFLGLAESSKTTAHNVPDALMRIVQQVSGVIYPENFLIFSILISIIIVVLILKKKKFHFRKQISGLSLITIWVTIPLCGYLIHAAPGTAYFPLLFPPIIFLTASAFSYVIESNRIGIILVVVISLINFILIITNDYFLTTPQIRRSLPPFDYHYGIAIFTQEELARRIVLDAKNKPFRIKGGGYLGTLATGTENYEYLVWYFGGKISNNSNLTYTIYEDTTIVPKNTRIIYSNPILAVTKNENR